MADAKTPWGGRFGKPLDAFIAEFGASLPVDRRLWREDIRGSVAHVRMLGAPGHHPGRGRRGDRGRACARSRPTSPRDASPSATPTRTSTWRWSARCARRSAPVAGKLHTARSRNDQVALDTRLYATRCRGRASRTASAALRATLLKLAEEHLGVVLPGYTHLQRAQPVLLSHHLLAYFWMLTRDVTRLRHALRRRRPHAARQRRARGHAVPDRPRVRGADELGFSAVTANSMDAVSDRDFALDLDVRVRASR